jgi:chemotaxis protein CheD
MEQLINQLLSRGSGKKSNLEIKIFGGGVINAALRDIGSKNIDFVHEFIVNEGYVIASEDVGGTYARRVLFKPATGRAFVKRLDAAAGASVASEELAIADGRLTIRPLAADIELF